MVFQYTVTNNNTENSLCLSHREGPSMDMVAITPYITRHQFTPHTSNTPHSSHATGTAYSPGSCVGAQCTKTGSKIYCREPNRNHTKPRRVDEAALNRN